MHSVLTLSLFATSVWIALPPSPAQAQTPNCDELTGFQKILAGELLTSQRPYDCCGESVDACLRQKPTCSLAFRLADAICGRVADGQSKDMIVAALDQRYRDMLQSGREARIDLDGLVVAGDSDAPVTLVEYACPRCPYCAMMTPQIYDSVTKGQLKGKAKLYFKTFPIRGHPHTQESGLAFVSSQHLGHFWEFVLYSYQRFDLFSPSNQLAWAEATGMEKEAFERTMADPSTRMELIEIKREGLANNVNATPTFFLDGRKLHGAFSTAELIGIVEEEFDRLRGIRYRGANQRDEESQSPPQKQDNHVQTTHRRLTLAEARQLMARQPGETELVILDLRTRREFAQGHLPRALNTVDFTSPDAERHLDSLDKKRAYLIYCSSGNLSSRALTLMASKGFQAVYELGGGLLGWKQAGFEVVTE